jgi:hypothetical protein
MTLLTTILILECTNKYSYFENSNVDIKLEEFGLIIMLFLCVFY